jgi:diguanylate cyclase (GGDEF)-like protein/PAS domain S-box-containing protein
MTPPPELYQGLFMNLTVPVIILDREHRIQARNPAAARLFSPNPSPPAQVYEEGGIGSAVPWLEEELRAMLALGEKESSFEKRLQTTQGERCFQVTLRPLPKPNGGSLGMLVMLADLTEQKRTEEALRESELRFRSLVQSADDAIVLSDGHGNILSWNQGAQAIFGYEESEILGKPLTMLFPDPFHQASRDSLGEVHLGGAFRKNGKTAEGNGVRKDGSRFPVELSVAVWDVNGETFYSGIIRDISERKRAEALVRLLSLTDDLTGLYNRRGFLTLAEQELKLAARTKRRMYLLFVDLDGMKWINDTLGHQEGDRAIRDAAALLKHTYRESDIIARIGGDEFAVLVHEARKEDERALTSRLERNLAAHNGKENQLFNLSLSIGVVSCDAADPCSLEVLLDRADRLMYEEKQRKRKNGNIPDRPRE